MILIDANEGVTEQDTKIAGYVHEEGKACVVVVNKWDAVDKDTGTMEKVRRQVMQDLSFMSYARTLFISALTGQRVNRIVEEVDAAYAQASHRIPTGVLNDILHDAITMNEPPYIKGKQLKIYYATQAGVCPPTFILFVNDIRRMHFSYERYLENQFRKAFGFEGTPIRLIARNRNEGDPVKLK